MDKKPLSHYASARIVTTSPRKARVYIAGKISKSDFRHQLLPGLRNHHWDDGFMETDTYVYTGPMFQSCDHGCSHGPNTHGATAGCDGGATQKQILIRNNHAIDNADLVFAYITHADCYGTLIEIGQAAVLGKRVVVAFATGFEPKPDFWYAAYSADIVYDNVNPCCIPNILAGEIDRLNQSSSLGPRETE